MFEMLPYGARIKLKCTKSSKEGPLVTSYTNATTYTLENKPIGLDNCYFLESYKEPVEMTYTYTKENGILVDIDTNLTVKSETLNNDGSGSFTISNETWFNNGKTSVPYIKLCFNKVKVECCFTNPWNGTGGSNCDNGWKLLANNSGADKLRPVSESAQNYCDLARYITISWNSYESNQLFFSQYINDYHWYQIWFSYGMKNGSIKEFSTDNNLAQRLWSHTQSGTASYTVNIPPLNGTGSINGITPYNYFKIGYTINFAGESDWQQSSTLKVNGNYYVYDKEGFNKLQTVNSNLNSSNSSPILYSHPADVTWGSNSKFYLTSAGEYISPANGVTINSSWVTSSYCVPHSDCYTNPDCYNQSCGETKVSSVTINNPNGSYGGITVYTSNGHIFVRNGTYTVTSYSGSSYTISGDFYEAIDSSQTYNPVSSCTVSGEYVTPNYDSSSYDPNCYDDCYDCYDCYDCFCYSAGGYTPDCESMGIYYAS